MPALRDHAQSERDNERHYETVAAALLSTLTKGLGDEFTSELGAAWIEMYGVIADAMRTAAHVHTEA